MDPIRKLTFDQKHLFIFPSLRKFIQDLMRIKIFHWITRLLLLAMFAGALPMNTSSNSIVAQEQDKKKKKKKKPSKKKK